MKNVVLLSTFAALYQVFLKVSGILPFTRHAVEVFGTCRFEEDEVMLTKARKVGLDCALIESAEG